MNDHGETPKPEVTAEHKETNVDMNSLDQQKSEQTIDEANQDEQMITLEAYEAQKHKAEENWNALLRTRAEMDNLRKRQARELENARKFALERFLTDLLPVKDSLEAGISNFSAEVSIEKLKEGTELTLQMLTKLLTDYQITEINPINEKFNPSLHEAMTIQESTKHEAEIVVTVLQKGYLLNERLVRPARVIVSK